MQSGLGRGPGLAGERQAEEDDHQIQGQHADQRPDRLAHTKLRHRGAPGPRAAISDARQRCAGQPGSMGPSGPPPGPNAPHFDWNPVLAMIFPLMTSALLALR